MKQFSLLEDASRIVSKVLNVTGVRTQVVESGVMTHKVLVQHPTTGPLIVRFYPAERSHVVHYEPDLFIRLRAFGIATAEVVADSRTGPASALAYMVYRMIPGVTLETRLASLGRQALDAIASDLASFMERIASLEVQGFGDLVSAEHGMCADCRQFIADAFNLDFAALRDEEILPADWCDWFMVVQGNLDEFDLPPAPSLAWGDLSPQNIILDERDRIVGLIDLESMVACEPLATFGFFSARYWNTPLCTALQARTGWDPDEKRLHLYGVLRAARILRHAQSSLPTGVHRLPITVLLPGVEHSLRRLCS